MIDIKGLDKAEVLRALYNGSQQQGLGYLDDRGSSDMTAERSKETVEARPKLTFDYLHGRVMKVDLAKDSFCPILYDRDNGDGAAEALINTLRSKQNESSTS